MYKLLLDLFIRHCRSKSILSTERMDFLFSARNSCLKHSINNQRGLTLTEMMTVLAILTILATIGVGSFMSSLPRYRLNATARDLVSDMRLARQQAVTENRQYAVRFTSTSSYEVVRGDQPQLQSSGVLTPVIIRSNMESGAGRGEIRFSSPVRMPVFHPDGLISSWDSESGTFQTDLPDSVTLNNSNGLIKTVTLSRVGRIKIQSYGP